MSSPTRYIKGQWKAVCDVCGFRFDSSQLKPRWDGLMVCSNDWEPRQPQDFVRAKADIQAVPWARPESVTYTFAYSFNVLTEAGDNLITEDSNNLVL